MALLFTFACGRCGKKYSVYYPKTFIASVYGTMTPAQAEREDAEEAAAGAIDAARRRAEGAGNAWVDVSQQSQVTCVCGKNLNLNLADHPRVGDVGHLAPVTVHIAQRSAVLPDVPAIAETVPGYELSVWFAIAAPGGTPRPIVEKIRAAALGALGEKSVIEAFTRDGAEIATSTPEELHAIMVADYAKYGALIKSLTIKD